MERSDVSPPNPPQAGGNVTIEIHLARQNLLTLPRRGEMITLYDEKNEAQRNQVLWSAKVAFHSGSDGKPVSVRIFSL